MVDMNEGEDRSHWLAVPSAGGRRQRYPYC